MSSNYMRPSFYKKKQTKQIQYRITKNKFNTFSPLAEVNAKVEKIGNGACAFSGQHSTTAPRGKQNNGTESGRGNPS